MNLLSAASPRAPGTSPRRRTRDLRNRALVHPTRMFTLVGVIRCAPRRAHGPRSVERRGQSSSSWSPGSDEFTEEFTFAPHELEQGDPGREPEVHDARLVDGRNVARGAAVLKELRRGRRRAEIDDDGQAAIRHAGTKVRILIPSAVGLIRVPSTRRTRASSRLRGITVSVYSASRPDATVVGRNRGRSSVG